MRNEPNKQPSKPPTGPEILNIVAKLGANFEARMELMDHQTRILWARYTLLMDKGFTADQAVVLCTEDWGNAL